MRKNTVTTPPVFLLPVILAIITISLSSCFFTGNIVKHSLSKEYINPVNQSVKQAAIKDSTLSITYISTYKKSNSDTYNFSVPVDSLIRYFNNSNHTILSISNSLYRKLYEVWYSGQEIPQFGKGLVIRLNDEAILKGEQPGTAEKKHMVNVSIITNDSLFNYDAVEYAKKDISELPEKKYDKFMYPLNNISRNQFKYIVIISERKKKTHLNRLLLLPFSLAADIITFPVQLVIKITRDKLDRPSFFEFPNYIR